MRQLLKYICLVSAILGTAVGAYARPVVTKVEPPNWWTGHSLNPVRVLIYGSGLSGAGVTASGLTAGGTRVSPNGTYLFVDGTILAGTKPGNYPLQIATQDGSVSAPFRIDEPLNPAGRFAGFSPDDVIYLIMPDRFADGDPANDRLKGMASCVWLLRVLFGKCGKPESLRAGKALLPVCEFANGIGICCREARTDLSPGTASASLPIPSSSFGANPTSRLASQWKYSWKMHISAEYRSR